MPSNLPDRPGPDGRVNKWFLPCALLICAAFLYLEAFSLPCTPRAATGDQSIYLHDAARMFDGQAIYRDFDHFTLPGTSTLYLMLFNVFGVKAWIPQAMLVLTGCLIAWLSFGICQKLLRGTSAFLPGFAFLALPFTGYFDGTHHWYSTLAATAALAVLMERRTQSRVACAGVFWGIGTCFAQSIVLGMIGLSAFLVWEARREQEPRAALIRKEAAAWVAYVATVVAFNAYFIWKAGFRNFFFNTVVFVARYYPKDAFNTWAAYFGSRIYLHPWTNILDVPAWLLVHLLLPLIYILVFVRYWREGKNPEIPWARLMLVNVAGLSMLLTVASAPSFSRLYTVSLPALILLVWFLDQTHTLERILLRVLWVTVVVVALGKPVMVQKRWNTSLDLPTGRTALSSVAAYDKTKWLLERTKPADYFFGDQFLGFALRLRNPGRVPFLRPTDYTRPEQVSDLMRGLEEHQVEFVDWYAGLDDEVVDPRGDHLGPLRNYLHAHYRVGTTFPNGERIWERVR